ncbi:putative ankyrin repeat-containing domain, PGG domain, ankyrin repeat-containing domain superfamily [Helianthus debilis subsp. tardiflorus]
MCRLLDSNNMCGIVDATFATPRFSGTEIMRQYDSLVKGWIFASVTEDVLVNVFNLDSAKAVWDKLKSIHDPTVHLQEETNTTAESESIEIIVVQDQSPQVNEDTRNLVNKIELKKKLYEGTVKGDWSELKSVLKKDEGLVTEAISGDGSTVLHLAVGIGHNHLVKKLLSYINDLQVLEKRYSDGSTPLHVAATVGNKHAVELLLKKNCQLLHIEDHNAKLPLQKAYENMQLDIIGYLLKATNDAYKTELQSSLRGPFHPDDDVGVRLIVNAIVAKQYSLALVLVRNFPRFSSYSDEVLYSMAKSFPDGERFVLFSSIKKKREQSEAKEVLEIVCDEIDKLEYSGTYHPFYTRPILEASCQNAVEVVHEILIRSPEAIQSTDKNGYGIIQLAIIHRSEKVFRYIYEIGEHKNLYRTLEDSCKNNMLHLAGKLAPVSVRDQRTRCPALQLQQDLQWQEEIKKCVCPTYITKENILKETPDMIFNKEHKNLVKEGERWMRTMAKSCTIIAVLITTLTFTAAITIPGGSNQVKGTPFLENKKALILFSISNTISLFASITTLLVFWSIQASCYHVNDFLVSLPRKVFTGLFFLVVSATAMMVAFSAVLFLVFCHQIRWMLAPIAVLAIIPTAFVVTLQFPLMVEFFKSTYLGIFGNHRKQIR